MTGIRRRWKEEWWGFLSVGFKATEAFREVAEEGMYRKGQ
jgi:hypothetical protein